MSSAGTGSNDVEQQLLDAERLSQLRQPVTASMDLGGRPYVVTTSPVLDADGRLLGTVGQWQDVQAQRRAEAEISQVVDGALQGNFAERIGIEGKDDFFKMLAERFNALLDSVGDTIREVRVAADQLSSASEQVSQTSQSLSHSASQAGRRRACGACQVSTPSACRATV